MPDLRVQPAVPDSHRVEVENNRKSNHVIYVI